MASGPAGPATCTCAGPARCSGHRPSGQVAGPCCRMSLTVPPGSVRRPGARGIGSPLPAQPPDAAGLWRTTHAEWAREVPSLEESIATRDARQAYVVLRGLTSSSGGMVAAATTSLPERAQAGRNYDYRYAWIRDQCYAGQAAATAGTLPLLDDAVRFVSQRLHADGAELSPPIPWMAAGCRTSDSSTCLATRAASTWSATG